MWEQIQSLQYHDAVFNAISPAISASVRRFPLSHVRKNGANNSYELSFDLIFWHSRI